MKKLSLPKKAFIFDPVFNYEILVIKGGTFQRAVNAYCKKEGLDPILVTESDSRRGNFFVNQDSGPGGLLWLHKDAGIGCIVHECFHVIYYNLYRKGIQLVDESEEVFAYSLQFLFNQIMIKVEGWR